MCCQLILLTFFSYEPQRVYFISTLGCLVICLFYSSFLEYPRGLFVFYPLGVCWKFYLVTDLVTERVYDRYVYMVVLFMIL